LNLYAGYLCKLLGIPVVQELCEWLQAEPSWSAFNRWLYRKSIFKLATGVLVISKAIEQRVITRNSELNLRLIVHRLPVIVDATRFAAASPVSDAVLERIPTFVYCGTWLKDVLFVLRAFSFVKLRGFNSKLRIVGGWNRAGMAAILQELQERGLCTDVVLTGVVDDRTLETLYKAAAALLAPLWDDDRSKTRLPNKIGEYLASGRPVIGCKIGDLTEFLVDDVNAFLAEPGNERAFAEKMIAVLRHPERAAQIGRAGQKTCIACLDYRVHADMLATFFSDCINQHKYRRSVA
jgi:glycosyltransferase involved in cell wall biosynthesis